MNYEVLLNQEAESYYQVLDDKSKRIVRDNLQKLEDDPYPGNGKGDKEKLVIEGEEVYRLHVGRTHTAFYVVMETEEQVRVIDMMTIDQAHKLYD